MARSARMSSAQMELLLDAMSANQELAFGRYQGFLGKQTAQRQWTELASQLNAVGSGATKDGKSWKKAWTDWKSKTKAKAAKLRNHLQGTGGGPASEIHLTELEERLIGFIGWECVNGNVNVPEGGFPQNLAVDEDVNNIMELPQPSPRATGAHIVDVFDSNNIEMEFIDEAVPSTSHDVTSTPAPLQPRSSSSSSRRRLRPSLTRRATRASVRNSNAINIFADIESRRLEIEKMNAEANKQRAEAETKKALNQQRKLDIQEAQLIVIRELIDEIKDLKEVIVAKLN